jgi:DNA polymerase III epsilon subunit-like protein
MVAQNLTWDKMLPIVHEVVAGKRISVLALEHDVCENSIRKFHRLYLAGKCPASDKHPPETERPFRRRARKMFLDIETLPNEGYFFDVYSDRGIPLQFVKRQKAICTISYKFDGDEKVTVLVARAPYDDKSILEQLLPETERAEYIVWHFGEGFDRPFIDGRLLIHGLPALPPINSIDTYKLARSKFGKSLNSNRLDHLGELLGVGRKNKTDASLWVRCAEGDPDALEEMARYNAQDVLLLEAVYNKLAPNVRSKVNYNLLHDDAVLRCKPCGSTNIELKGHELVNATFRHRYQCHDCHAWSTFPKKAVPK